MAIDTATWIDLFIGGVGVTRSMKLFILIALLVTSFLSLGFYPDSPDANHVLMEFIEDLRSGEANRLNRWFGNSGLNVGRDILTDQNVKFVDVLFPPVITEDQIAAIFIVWDDDIEAYANFTLFFRKSLGSWEIYGFFPDRSWKRAQK